MINCYETLLMIPVEIQTNLNQQKLLILLLVFEFETGIHWLIKHFYENKKNELK